jgi:hypothetical protein
VTSVAHSSSFILIQCHKPSSELLHLSRPARSFLSALDRS